MSDKDYVKTTLNRLNESSKEKSKYFVTVMGKRFVVYPNVFSPKYFGDTSLFAENISVKEREEFLEIGCGCGVISVLAALRGASKVVAIDINPEAVKNTEENSKLHKVSQKVTALRGDVYSPLHKDKFDTIFWNIPFLDSSKNELSLLDLSVFDPNYRSVRRFAESARDHLKHNGRIIIGFSTTMGNYNKIKEIFEKEGLPLKLIKKITSDYGKPIGKITLELFESLNQP